MGCPSLSTAQKYFCTGAGKPINSSGLYVFLPTGRRAASSLACISFVADWQRREPYISATVMNTVNPRVTIRIIFHHTSLSSPTQAEWPALKGSASGSSVGRASTLPLRASSHTITSATGRRNECGSCGPRPKRRTRSARRDPSEPLSELRAHSRDFDRLIDESGTHAEFRRSQRETLVSAADFEPVCWVGAPPDKDCHVSR